MQRISKEPDLGVILSCIWGHIKIFLLFINTDTIKGLRKSIPHGLFYEYLFQFSLYALLNASPPPDM